MYSKFLCVAALAALPSVVAAEDGALSAEQAAQAQAVAEACATGSNMPAAMCTCMGDRAVAGLNADQRAFVIATFRQQAAEILRLRAAIPAQDLAAAAMFIATTPQHCISAGD